MEAYRQGATGDTVLAKTKEMKRYHRVPLRIDPQPRVGYDRNRGRQALENMRGNETDREVTDRSEQVSFDQETFAEKIRLLNPSWNPGRRIAKVGELVRVFFREAPRAEFLAAVGGKFHFDHLLEEHRSYQSMLDEWSGVTHVTFHDDSEWRAYWRGERGGEEGEEGGETRSAALRSPEVNNDNGGDDGGDYNADDRPDDVGAGEGVGEAEDGGGEDDGHHSDMDLGLLAESEFESEGEGYGAEGGDDGSTPAAQSIQTGATSGSDALFSDDESAESSHPEDEESDAGKADEQWAEGFTFNED